MPFHFFLGHPVYGQNSWSFKGDVSVAGTVCVIFKEVRDGTLVEGLVHGRHSMVVQLPREALHLQVQWNGSIIGVEVEHVLLNETKINEIIPCVPEKRKPILSVRYLCHARFNQTICFIIKGIFSSFI